MYLLKKLLKLAPPSSITRQCRSLDIDYAPALTGFELQGGRSVPKIDGVVVCEEFEAQVRGRMRVYPRRRLVSPSPILVPPPLVTG